MLKLYSRGWLLFPAKSAYAFADSAMTTYIVVDINF